MTDCDVRQTRQIADVDFTFSAGLAFITSPVQHHREVAGGPSDSRRLLPICHCRTSSVSKPLLIQSYCIVECGTSVVVIIVLEVTKPVRHDRPMLIVRPKPLTFYLHG
jgi:hypothetical protein